MSDEATSQSPFSRPGFLIAAAAVIGIVVVAVALILTNNRADPAPVVEPSKPAQSSASPAGDDDASVCGLEGEVLEGRLTSAPAVDAWEYQLTTAYPVSSEYGPGATSEDGVHHCYQRSPEGALFAATTALAQATDPSIKMAFAEYFVTHGPGRDEFVSAAEEPGDTDVRLAPAGFRLLAYDGSNARLDIAMTSLMNGNETFASLVYALTWSDGDWKLDSNDPQPASFAAIPDLNGYVPWGE